MPMTGLYILRFARLIKNNVFGQSDEADAIIAELIIEICARTQIQVALLLPHAGPPACNHFTWEFECRFVEVPEYVQRQNGNGVQKTIR